MRVVEQQLMGMHWLGSLNDEFTYGRKIEVRKSSMNNIPKVEN